MAATLKVDEETKVLLDRLQAALTLWTGEKPSLQELVERLVRRGWDQRADIAAELRGWRPATQEEIDQMFARIRELEATVGTSPAMSQDDQELYGDGA